jgi:hypothetical protein
LPQSEFSIETPSDLCDNILAMAHRAFMIKSNTISWSKTSFHTNPFGLPRRAYHNVPYNRVPMSPTKYSMYRKRAIDALRRYKDAFDENGYQIKWSGRLAYEDGRWQWIINRANWGRKLTQISRQDSFFNNIPPKEVQWLNGDLRYYWQKLPQLRARRSSLLSEEAKNEYVAEALAHIALLHSLFEHAEPYRRGSAAIGDMLTKVVFDYLGITTPNWRSPGSHRADNPYQDLENFINQHGVAADLEAYVTPLNSYIQHYPYFFESMPNFIENWQEPNSKDAEQSKERFFNLLEENIERASDADVQRASCIHKAYLEGKLRTTRGSGTTELN